MATPKRNSILGRKRRKPAPEKMMSADAARLLRRQFADRDPVLQTVAREAARIEPAPRALSRSPACRYCGNSAIASIADPICPSCAVIREKWEARWAAGPIALQRARTGPSIPPEALLFRIQKIYRDRDLARLIKPKWKVDGMRADIPDAVGYVRRWFESFDGPARDNPQASVEAAEILASDEPESAVPTCEAEPAENAPDNPQKSWGSEADLTSEIRLAWRAA
jgi:hypothetical protein